MSERVEAAKSRKRKGDSPRESLHVKLDWAFVGFLALSPLMLGGTHPVLAIILAFGGLTFAILDIVLRASAKEPFRIPFVAWFLLAVVAFALLRNTGVLAFLSPGIVREGFDLWPEVVAHGTASPGRTALWCAKLLGVIGALVYGANRFRRSDKVWKLALAVVLAGVVTAVIGIAQDLLNADGHLFFYTPLDWDRVMPIGGPFVNPNQAGSLAALSAIVSFAVAHQQQALKYRVIFVSSGLFLLGYTLMTGASAAALALTLSIGALVAAAVLTRDLERNTSRRRLLFGSILLGLAASTVFVIYFVAPLDAVPGPAKSAEKLELWRQAISVIGHGPLFGFGASSFQDVFPYFDALQRNEIARNVESGLLQFVIEQGIVPSLVLLGALVLLAVRTLTDRRLAKRFVFPSFVGIGVFLILDISLGMGLQSQSYAMMVGALVGAMAGRPRKAGRVARNVGPEGALWVGLLVVSIAVTSFGVARSARVSLSDSEVPYHHVESLSAVPGAIDAEAHARPLNLVVLIQTTGMRLAMDNIELADRTARFLMEHAANRPIGWRASFRVAQDERSTLDTCDMVNRYWNEFDEMPREIVGIVRSSPDFTECILDREPAEQCRFMGQLLPLIQADERFLLVNRMLESDQSECVLAAAVQLSDNSAFRPLAATWVRELSQMNNLQAETHLTLAEYHRSARDYGAELNELLAARDILNDNAEVGLAVLRSLLGIVKREEAADGWYQRFTAYAEAVRLDTLDDPDLSTALRRLEGEAAYLADDIATARREFESLRNLGSDRERATTHLFLARIARSEGRYREAINAYRMTIRFHPQNREANEALEDLNATVR